MRVVRGDLPELVDGLALYPQERDLMNWFRSTEGGSRIYLTAVEMEVLADALERLGRQRAHGLERLVRDVLDADPSWEGSE